MATNIKAPSGFYLRNKAVPNIEQIAVDKAPISLWWKPHNEHYDALMTPLTKESSLYVRPMIT